jgi:protein involved in polysaccharide export with SLBB domain
MLSAIRDRSARLLARCGWALVAICLTAPVLHAQTTRPASEGASDSLPAPRDVAGRPVGMLRPGDAINLIVFRNKELSGEFLIDARGNIQIPGLGEIAAGGVAPTEIKERIRAEMLRRGFQDPDLAVLPLLRIAVLGEVGKPGLYPLEPGTALLQLLTLAGGPTPNADLRKARVVREGRAFSVNLESALTGSASGRVVLYSNDVLVVPKKTGFTRERIQFLLSLSGAALAAVNVILSLRRN